MDLGFARGCNFYGIRARSHVSSFYKIRAGILKQLLRNKNFLLREARGLNILPRMTNVTVSLVTVFISGNDSFPYSTRLRGKGSNAPRLAAATRVGSGAFAARARLAC